MNVKQYKRLFLVLIFPLVLLGWWFAEAELLFENHALTECEEFQEHFSCASIQMSRKRISQYRDSSGGVFLWTGARLTKGLVANIVSSGVREMEYKDGALQEKQIVGAGLEKRLNIGMYAGAHYSGNGPCTLAPFAGNTGEWNLKCLDGKMEDFRFSNKSEHDKFVDLIEMAKSEASRISSKSKIGYIVAMVTPLVVFVILSWLVFLLRKLFLFVKYGAEKQNCNPVEK